MRNLNLGNDYANERMLANKEVKDNAVANKDGKVADAATEPSQEEERAAVTESEIQSKRKKGRNQKGN